MNTTLDTRGCVTQHGNVTVICIREEYLDHITVKQVGEFVLSAANDAEPPNVVVDLPRAKFIGSSCLGLLVRTWKSLERRGGRLALSGLSPHCREVLRVSRLDRLWPLSPSALEAIHELNEAA